MWISDGPTYQPSSEAKVAAAAFNLEHSIVMDGSLAYKPPPAYPRSDTCILTETAPRVTPFSPSAKNDKTMQSGKGILQSG